MELDGEESTKALGEADFKESINEYLEGLEIAKVKSLEELVQFNEDHAETELPEGYSNQDL